MTKITDSYDVIVVGSGPGGATVSRELSAQGKKTLILEWGNYKAVTGSFLGMTKDLFILGKSLYITKNLLGMVRGITTGGSTIYYCATAFDAPLDRLKKHGIDIKAEVDEITHMVPFGPLKDELISQAGKLFLESAKELGYPVQKANKFIYQDKCLANCDLCLLGCPHEAKWTARNWVDDSVGNGAEIINNAKVSKVIIENNKAVGVEFKHKKKTVKVYGKKIVIAAGGLGSPMILRNSGISGVGYNFIFDPLWYTMGKVDSITSGKGVPMCGVIDLEEEGITLTDHNLPRLTKAIFDLQGFKPHKLFSYNNIVPIMAKVRDGFSGRLGKNGWVWKDLSKSDWHKLNAGYEHSKKILENAGATSIYKTPLLAAHPGGTVKVGEHLDTDLKTKYDNLYVCDASAIPCELGLPPTLTILAMAKRLSKHLLEND